MQGAGNDFVVLDLIAQPVAPDFDFALAAQELCARRFGAGADGLLTLEPSTTRAAVQMRMWNPDGTLDMCGNGLRCVVALAARQNYVQTPDFAVETLVGLREVSIVRPNFVRAAMGIPLWSPAQIPMDWAEASALDYSIEVGDTTVKNVSSLSTGSTHTVIFRKKPMDEENFQRLSPLLEIHPIFPQRTSIMWAHLVGPNHFRLRIWERGAGETLACGTGACAVAAAAWETGRAQGEITVESKGGILQVEKTGDGEIFLSGPADYVYRGVFQATHET